MNVRTSTIMSDKNEFTCQLKLALAPFFHELPLAIPIPVATDLHWTLDWQVLRQAAIRHFSIGLPRLQSKPPLRYDGCHEVLTSFLSLVGGLVGRGDSGGERLRRAGPFSCRSSAYTQVCLKREHNEHAGFSPGHRDFLRLFVSIRTCLTVFGGSREGKDFLTGRARKLVGLVLQDAQMTMT